MYYKVRSTWYNPEDSVSVKFVLSAGTSNFLAIYFDERYLQPVVTYGTYYLLEANLCASQSRDVELITDKIDNLKRQLKLLFLFILQLEPLVDAMGTLNLIFSCVNCKICAALGHIKSALLQMIQWKSIFFPILIISLFNSNDLMMVMTSIDMLHVGNSFWLFKYWDWKSSSFCYNNFFSLQQPNIFSLSSNPLMNVHLTTTINHQ